MAWHVILKNGQPDEIVATLDGVDLDGRDAVPILANRAPTEFQDVTGDGRLVANVERRATTMKRKRWAEMDRADLIDTIDDLQARMAALESKERT